MFKLLVMCGIVCICFPKGQAAPFEVMMAFNTPVDQGSNVTMTCSWNQPNDIFLIYWYKGQVDAMVPNLFDSTQGTAEMKVVLRATVTRIRVKEEDEGYYWCRIYWTQAYISNRTSSNALKLSVTAPSTTSEAVSANTSPGDYSTAILPDPSVTTATIGTNAASSSGKTPTTDIEKDQDNCKTTVSESGVTDTDETAVQNSINNGDPNAPKMPLSIGVIAGATVGGVVLLAVVGAMLFIVWKRRKQVNQEDNIEGNNNTSMPSKNETAVDLDEAVYDNVRRPYTMSSPGTYESLQIPTQRQGNPESRNNFYETISPQQNSDARNSQNNLLSRIMKFFKR